MSYHEMGATGAEESVCQYGASKLWFRGPKRVLDEPYVACVGGGETFGRFVDHPFPAVLEQRLGRTCVNFGSLFSGAEAMAHDAELLTLMNGADLCVLQLPPVLNQTNQFYRVHPRRNDRVLGPAPDLVELYPEIDFTDVHFVRHLTSKLVEYSDARFEVVARELRRAWLDSLHSLLSKIQSQVVLLWLDMNHQEPFDAAGFRVPDPVGINADMVDALSNDCDGAVAMTVRPSGASDDLEDMLFGTLQQPMAEHMIGPATHRMIAETLLREIRDLD